MISNQEKIIESEILSLEQEIKFEEEENTKRNSLLTQYNIYKHAKEVCTAAKALLEESRLNLSESEKKIQYEYLLEALKKIKKTVLFPSLENANDISEYQHQICYSTQACEAERNKKFWGAVKAFAGAVVYATAFVSLFFLPMFGPGAIMTYFFLGLLADRLLQTGLKEYVESRDKLGVVKHLHLPTTETTYAKSQNFLTKLSLFKDSAKMIGKVAEAKYTEKHGEMKNEELKGFMKTA